MDGEWLRTGDLGRVDSAGFVYIDGRAKDVIVNANGKNIFPAEVEAAVLTSGAIKEACVLGVLRTSGCTNETIAVLVVPEEGVPAEEVHRELRRTRLLLTDYKRPALYAIWPDEAFPRTATMKIKKHEVRDRLDGIDLLSI